MNNPIKSRLTVTVGTSRTVSLLFDPVSSVNGYIGPLWLQELLKGGLKDFFFFKDFLSRIKVFWQAAGPPATPAAITGDDSS